MASGLKANHSLEGTRQGLLRSRGTSEDAFCFDNSANHLGQSELNQEMQGCFILAKVLITPSPPSGSSDKRKPFSL